MANQESLIIKDSGGTEADVTAANALKVDGSAVTQPISDAGGSITVDGTVAVSNFPASQAVTLASVPLPTGASTSALQGTTNTSLSSIDTKTPALGQALAAASTPVVLTAIQQAALTPPAAITGFNLETTQLLVKAKTDNIPAQGQALAAASVPVVLTAAQIITLTPPAAITGFATSALQQNDALTNTQLRAAPVPISGTVTATPTGTQNVDVTANTIGLATESSLNATKVNTGNTATSVASIDGKTPALGQATMVNSSPVVIASNQSAIPVTLTSTTITGTTAISAASLPLPTGASTLLEQQSQTTHLATLAGTVSAARILVSGQVTLNAGTNLVGKVGIDQTTPGTTNKVSIGTDGTVGITGSVAVTGTFFQATQPVSIASTVPVSGTFFQATQPVSLATNTPDVTDRAARLLGVISTGANTIGNVNIIPAAITKGTQGTTGVTTQDLKDAGRNVTNHFMAAPIITTAAEVMQSLSGYKSGAAVTATVTPAVVTTGKTYRITEITLTYFNVATVGSVRFTLRVNTAGVAVIGSPLVWSKQIGANGDGVSTAGHVNTVVIPIPDGLEFAAGTGIAIGIQGFGAVPTTGTIVGYGKIEISGYEY